MGTTRSPRPLERTRTLMLSPLARTSSIMFRATTTGTPSSISCTVRYRLRSMLVASTMLMTALGFCSSKKSLVTTSSAV